MPDKIVWWQPQMTGGEYSLIKQAIEANYINEGDMAETFERKIAAFMGVKHVIACTSGTAALFLALFALGLKPNDEVLVPDITFIATANAVVLAGGKPVLVDIDPKTLCLDPEATRKAITPKTKAIMPVHVSGRTADMPALMKLAKEHNLWMVEDAAEGLLSKRDGKFAGTWGEAGCFSFSPNKTITTGQGGIVVTNDDALAVRLREAKDQGRPVRGTGGDDTHHSIGFNFKFTNLQAAVGLAQLESLQKRMKRQQEIYSYYALNLKGIAGLKILPFDIEGGEVPQWTDALVERRAELDKLLAEQGIGCRRFWHPIHTQAPYRQSDSLFPNAMRCSQQALWLPSAFVMAEEQQARVCDVIRKFFVGKAS